MEWPRGQDIFWDVLHMSVEKTCNFGTCAIASKKIEDRKRNGSFYIEDEQRRAQFILWGGEGGIEKNSGGHVYENVSNLI